MNYRERFITIYGKEYCILIGKTQKGNDEILRMSNPENLWFHFENISGPHLILQSGENIKREDLYKIGNILREYKKTSDRIIFTKIKNIITTKKLGEVLLKDYEVL